MSDMIEVLCMLCTLVSARGRKRENRVETMIIQKKIDCATLARSITTLAN